MSINVVLFHGLEGTPRGTKNTALADVARTMGYTTHIADHTGTMDPEERVALAIQEFGELCRTEPTVLVGSSMGGYVATVMASQFPLTGLFLMAPALYREGYAVQTYSPRTTSVVVVHGVQDDVVPIAISRRFAGHTGARLFEVQDGHRLGGDLANLRRLFRGFCEGLNA
jgi:hypothetical protein